MNISDFLSVDNVVVIEQPQSKRQLLQELSEVAAISTGIDARCLFDVVLERENLGSTAFGGGTAIPHARISNLNNAKAIFAKLNKAIDFQANDNKPVDLVFMLFSPENSGADHLTALSSISTIVKDNSKCEKLRLANTSSEIYKILSE